MDHIKSCHDRAQAEFREDNVFVFCSLFLLSKVENWTEACWQVSFLLSVNWQQYSILSQIYGKKTKTSFNSLPKHHCQPPLATLLAGQQPSSPPATLSGNPHQPPLSFEKNSKHEHQTCFCLGPFCFDSVEWLVICSWLCLQRTENFTIHHSNDLQFYTMHIIRLTEQEKFSISGAAECLEWKIRFKVALGVAEGLQYLHCECHRRIIHRDITASNILLTEDNEPQVIISLSIFLSIKFPGIWLPDVNNLVLDIWFWACKMATRKMDSPCCRSHRGNIRVREPTSEFMFGILDHGFAKRISKWTNCESFKL